MPERETISKEISIARLNTDIEYLIRKTTNGIPNTNLKLMILACEEKGPYGPAVNTANMFLNAFSLAQERVWNMYLEENGHLLSENSNILQKNSSIVVSVSITIYNCVKNDYPTTKKEWDSYQGIILSGSFSAAYDETPWILKLKEMIRDEIQKYSRPTLGVCFGHQIYAHALEEWKDSTTIPCWGGRATKCPKGTQAGRRSFQLTSEGSSLLFQHFHDKHEMNFNHKDSNKRKRDGVQLLYTHSDMVELLPSCAVSLGGNSIVPIQSAAYFSSSEESQIFRSSIEAKSTNTSLKGDRPSPHVFTFQAHPEYVSASDVVNLGCSGCLNTKGEKNGNAISNYLDSGASFISSNYNDILDLLEKKGFISKESVTKEIIDSRNHEDILRNDSLCMIMNVSRNLKWL